MPYLNEARIIGNMANKPEMDFLSNGIPYCYFAVRIVQSMPDGTLAEDFLRVISYGDTAVFIVRELNLGDLVLCVGRLSPKQWQSPNGIEEYRLHFIAETVDLLAGSDGLIPPVTIRDASRAKAAAFRMGEDERIHSDTYRLRGARDQHPPKLYEPQPTSGGSWTIPEGYLKQESLSWIEKERKRQKSRTGEYAKREVPLLDLRDADDKAEAMRIASSFIPWNLPMTNDGLYVRMPNGKCIPVQEYNAMIASQDRILSRQDKATRDFIMNTAAAREIFIKAATNDARRQERAARETDGLELVEDEKRLAPAPLPEAKPTVGSSNPDAWFKD